jgi:hypothetical protein
MLHSGQVKRLPGVVAWLHAYADLNARGYRSEVQSCGRISVCVGDDGGCAEVSCTSYDAIHDRELGDWSRGAIFEYLSDCAATFGTRKPMLITSTIIVYPLVMILIILSLVLLSLVAALIARSPFAVVAARSPV